ncbi:hypothetical protein [Streptomyces sp. NPDC002690]
MRFVRRAALSLMTALAVVTLGAGVSTAGTVDEAPVTVSPNVTEW